MTKTENVEVQLIRALFLYVIPQLIIK